METEQIEKPKRTRAPKPIPSQSTWGKSEFYSIAKQFNSETPDVQNTMIAISSMLQTIKLSLKEQPLVIIYLVKKAVPELGELAILGNLQLGIQTIRQNGPISGETLPELISSIELYLQDCTAERYDTFWHSMFTSIAAPLLPFIKVVGYSEYVYQVLVKGVAK